MNKCTWIMNLYFSRKFTHLLCFIMFDWCFVGPVQPMSLRSLAMVSQRTWAHTVGFVMWFISTVLLTDSCHDHAVIRDLSHYNPLVTPCVTLQDNTICARVSLNSCLLNRRHDSREVAVGKSKRGGGGAGNSWWGVPAGSPNPHPISDRKMSFSRPVFRPDL